MKFKHWAPWIEEEHHHLRARVSDLEARLSSVKHPTTEPDTKASPSDAPVQASTAAQTPASSQSDTRTDDAGDVGLSSACAHESLVPVGNPFLTFKGTGQWHMLTRCGNCAVLMEFALTPVPAAGPAGSTSARAASQPSDSALSRESEPSPSSVLTEAIETIGNLGDFEAKSESDKGYQMGITTAKAFLEMLMRKKAQVTR